MKFVHSIFGNDAKNNCLPIDFIIRSGTFEYEFKNE